MTTKPQTTGISLLRGLLESPREVSTISNQGKPTFSEGSEDSTNATSAKSGNVGTAVLRAGPIYRSSKLQMNSMPKMSSTISQTSQEPRSTNPYTTFRGDLNEHRGEKITVSTLANYCQQQKIYDVETFLNHATQGPKNRATEIYMKLATKDWDKKIQQAMDIARSFTPDTSF